MKTAYQYQEQVLSIISRENLPDIGVLGGIEIEHIIKKIKDNIKITTEVAGPGGRVVIYLNDYFHLKPSIFDFLSSDEYIELILKIFQTKEIPIIWMDKAGGNTRKVRNIEENTEYIDFRNTTLKVEPEFITEYLYNIKNLFIVYNSWNKKIIDLTKVKRRIFVDLREFCIDEIDKFTCDYLFLSSKKAYRQLAEKSSKLKANNKIILAKDAISFDRKIYEVKVKEKKYFEEAVSAFEANFISNIIKGYTLKSAVDSSFNLYNHVLECGTIPTEKL
ncbi:hypothetical protein X928_03705 [Petrotoga miotherma DSM 10691]|uniref:Uncharacterized protein n=2 Tax=Petrotoga TaxID=28236 RepID=A0A2K1PEB9_9BACT|nr:MULTISPECIES: hypothetical protein [Petrotoga]MDN5345943.1 hypothetical protein [Petrotoga sp.]PNS01140.1 hypothetical protein X928_03705 [Petrotoga miotherma DSM 10691]POZ93013.1 hypothetical protein AA81_04205 [Petrotoga halophila DSM 16923]